MSKHITVLADGMRAHISKPVAEALAKSDTAFLNCDSLEFFLVKFSILKLTVLDDKKKNMRKPIERVAELLAQELFDTCDKRFDMQKFWSLLTQKYTPKSEKQKVLDNAINAVRQFKNKKENRDKIEILNLEDHLD